MIGSDILDKSTNVYLDVKQTEPICISGNFDLAFSPMFVIESLTALSVEYVIPVCAQSCINRHLNLKCIEATFM